MFDVSLVNTANPKELWDLYMKHSHIVIYVVDSSDRLSLNSAKNDLHNSVLKHKDLHKSACILVLANKQDIDGSMTVLEIIEGLNLSSITNRKWHVQAVSVLQGLGLNQGVQWMERQWINKHFTLSPAPTELYKPS